MILSFSRNKRSANVVKWFSSTRGVDIFQSVVTIGEIERGIKQQQQTNSMFSLELTKWLDGILLNYSDRIIPISANITRRWGELSAKTGNSGADILIAAHALSNHLILITNNEKEFNRILAVKVENWAD